MAVREISDFGITFSGRKFIGLSTDAKPTDAPIGSTLLETDTLREFIYDGSNWKQR